jgi:Trp operon repressor
MKTAEFQALLLRTAVVAMAVDGEVAEREQEELAHIANSTAYFLGYDHATVLTLLLANSENTDVNAVARLVNAIEQGNLRENQEIVLVDVLLRVIEADEVVLAAEKDLLRALRPALRLPNATLFSQYPRYLEYLMLNDDTKLLE